MPPARLAARLPSCLRPTDTVAVQKTFLELYKQHKGEYFGSLSRNSSDQLEMFLGKSSKRIEAIRVDHAVNARFGDQRRAYRRACARAGRTCPP